MKNPSLLFHEVSVKKLRDRILDIPYKTLSGGLIMKKSAQPATTLTPKAVPAASDTTTDNIGNPPLPRAPMGTYAGTETAYKYLRQDQMW